MAFRALYIWFSQFRKIPFNDWVYWYSEYVLKNLNKGKRREKDIKKKQKQRWLIYYSWMLLCLICQITGGDIYAVSL